MQTGNTKENYTEEILKEILQELKSINLCLNKLCQMHNEDIIIKKQAQEKALNDLSKLTSMLPPSFVQMLNLPKKGDS